MAVADTEPQLESDDRGSGGLRASGAWTAPNAAALERLVSDAERGAPVRAAAIDAQAITALDTFGAWLIERLRRGLSQGEHEAAIIGMPAHYTDLLAGVRQVRATPPPGAPANPVVRLLDDIGRGVAGVGTAFLGLADLMGAVIAVWLRVLAKPRRLRLTSLVHHLEQVCWRAAPIVLLITFLIGCIIAQQGIFHFRRFGADVFVVDMLGVLVLREIGVLLVAIMVAGRSGSAYTAELGSMRMREEIDALRTMGLDPIEVLILPRIMALAIGLPILTFLGAMTALYGGGLVAWAYGGVDPDAFLTRLRDGLSINHFIVGMVKAPVMALVIGIVACVEGLAVEGSAESLGRRTTSSVVKGIFLVIVMDGIFAIFFATIGI